MEINFQNWCHVHRLRLIALKLEKRSASFAINDNNKLRTVPRLTWVPFAHGVRDVVHLSLACAVICAFTSNSSGEQERHRRYQRTSNSIILFHSFFIQFTPIRPFLHHHCHRLLLLLFSFTPDLKLTFLPILNVQPTGPLDCRTAD